MHARTLAWLFSLITLCSAATLDAAELATGAGRFEVTHHGRSIPVWYFRPAQAGAEARVLIVMHGVNRDADRYRDDWAPYARKYGFILAAPEFSKAAFPGDAGYTFGKGGAFEFIEPVFEAVKAGTGNRSERYFLYGHSAGAQFVHRFLYFVPGARVEKAVAANAGWWTLPDPGVKFPYGLGDSGVSEAALRTALQRPLTVLLGTADTDPNHVHLRRTPEALAQGPHRFARGHTFFTAGQTRAAALGVPLSWQLSTAPGVDHNDARMAPFAVKVLFGEPAADPQNAPANRGGG